VYAAALVVFAAVPTALLSVLVFERGGREVDLRVGT
jgi:hypothetical protein